MAQQKWQRPPDIEIDPAKSYTAEIETSAGAMKAQLHTEGAPKTVNNFVFLARQGFYDGVIFHRTIKGFMIQGGDPTGTGRGGPGYQFADEPVKQRYTRGTLAMANSGPNTNGCGLPSGAAKATRNGPEPVILQTILSSSPTCSGTRSGPSTRPQSSPLVLAP
jgi:hypothetical protein